MTPSAAVLLALAWIFICAGTALVSIPAALIVAGVLLAGAGVLMLEVRSTTPKVRR